MDRAERAAGSRSAATWCTRGHPVRDPGAHTAVRRSRRGRRVAGTSGRSSGRSSDGRLHPHATTCCSALAGRADARMLAAQRGAGAAHADAGARPVCTPTCAPWASRCCRAAPPERGRLAAPSRARRAGLRGTHPRSQGERGGGWQRALTERRAPHGTASVGATRSSRCSRRPPSWRASRRYRASGRRSTGRPLSFLRVLRRPGAPPGRPVGWASRRDPARSARAQALPRRRAQALPPAPRTLPPRSPSSRSSLRRRPSAGSRARSSRRP